MQPRSKRIRWTEKHRARLVPGADKFLRTRQTTTQHARQPSSSRRLATDESWQPARFIADQIIGSASVSDDEWLEVTVDLTKFAGRQIELSIENRPNDWRNEWAYWNHVYIVSE